MANTTFILFALHLQTVESCVLYQLKGKGKGHACSKGRKLHKFQQFGKSLPVFKICVLFFDLKGTNRIFTVFRDLIMHDTA